MKYEQLFVTSVFLGLCAACADQSTNTSTVEGPPKIFAIGRYALTSNRFRDLYDHVESVEPGGIKYDSEFRHPHLPISGLVIDCELTHRIGVTMAIDIPPKKKLQSSYLDRHATSWSKDIKVKYHWSHSEAEELDYSYYVVPSPYGSGNVLSDGMTLSKKNRFDGVWSVAVTYNGEQIYQTDFQLVRCPPENSQ